MGRHSIFFRSPGPGAEYRFPRSADIRLAPPVTVRRVSFRDSRPALRLRGPPPAKEPPARADPAPDTALHPPPPSDKAKQKACPLPHPKANDPPLADAVRPLGTWPMARRRAPTLRPTLLRLPPATAASWLLTPSIKPSWSRQLDPTTLPCGRVPASAAPSPAPALVNERGLEAPCPHSGRRL